MRARRLPQCPARVLCQGGLPLGTSRTEQAAAEPADGTGERSPRRQRQRAALRRVAAAPLPGRSRRDRLLRRFPRHFHSPGARCGGCFLRSPVSVRARIGRLGLRVEIRLAHGGLRNWLAGSRLPLHPRPTTGALQAGFLTPNRRFARAGHSCRMRWGRSSGRRVRCSRGTSRTTR